MSGTDGFINIIGVPTQRDELGNAERDFNNAIWAETCIMEDFTTSSGVSFNHPSEDYVDENDGLHLSRSDGGLSVVTSENFTDVLSTGNLVSEGTPYTGNNLANNPTAQEVLDGDFSVWSGAPTYWAVAGNTTPTATQLTGENARDGVSSIRYTGSDDGGVHPKTGYEISVTAGVVYVVTGYMKPNADAVLRIYWSGGSQNYSLGSSSEDSWKKFSIEITAPATEAVQWRFKGGTQADWDSISITEKYTADYPKDYLVEVTTPGAYGTAKCQVRDKSTGNIVVSDQTISEDTFITIENGAKFKWADSSLNFSSNDRWLIKALTGNIRHLLSTWDISSGFEDIQIEVSFNNGSNWIEVEKNKQYTEEKDWTTEKGNNLKWRITAPSSSNTVMPLLLIMVGDLDKYNYWDVNSI